MDLERDISNLKNDMQLVRDGSIIKIVNGVHFYKQDEEPKFPKDGDYWYDTTNHLQKMYNGTVWKTLTWT